MELGLLEPVWGERRSGRWSSSSVVEACVRTVGLVIDAAEEAGSADPELDRVVVGDNTVVKSGQFGDGTG